MSKRQRKQVEREELWQQGIKEYMASFGYPMAYGEQIMLADKSPLFCIDGTVAHLHCRINAVHNYSDVVDEDHHDVIYALARPEFRTG